MRIALICPSNLLYMPYVKNYKRVLDANKIVYDTIYWDRLHSELEGMDPLVYRDQKIGHPRNVIDYFKYKSFVEKKIKAKKYDKVIVFGIQLAFFLRKLLKKYKGQFILDIRDYNKILKYFNIEKIIKDSSFTVLSSEGFKDWLPKDGNYIINHNTRITNKQYEDSIIKSDGLLNISYIGTLRDLEVNINLIKSLKNNPKFNLNYHGEGIINKDIKSYLIDQQINNVRVTGGYKEDEEAELYRQSQFINVLIPNTDINSQTLLPNRLYNAVIFGKPILAINGTYLAKLVSENNLGLVINTFDDLDKEIQNYLDSFNGISYSENRDAFLEKVINENEVFQKLLSEFTN